MNRYNSHRLLVLKSKVKKFEDRDLDEVIEEAQKSIDEPVTLIYPQSPFIGRVA